MATFKSEREARAWLDGFIAWLTRSENDTKALYDVLYRSLIAGTAKCNDLQLYNHRAIGLWHLGEMIRARFRAAGLEVSTEHPWPAMFAHDVQKTTGVSPTGEEFPGLRAVLRCAEDGYPAQGLHIIRSEDPRANTRIVGFSGLGAPPLLVWGVVVIVTSAIALYGLKLVLDAITGTTRAEIDNLMRREWAADTLRLYTAYERCMDQGLARLNLPPDTDLATRTAALREIRESCERRLPVPSQPGSRGWLWWVGGIAIVSGLTLTGVLVYRARRGRQLVGQR